MATITGNYVYADPTQWWTLDYTFANSKFTWSVTAHASFTNYWNSIYGLTVNVGGNSYYKGDIDWRNYTPNTVVYSGTTNLSDCTVQNGVVTLSVSGNFYYGTWSADYRSSGSGTCAVDPPTVDTLTYSATNKYSNMVVSGRSVITFTMKGTSRTGSTSMSYSLYQDGSVISTTTGTSGTAKTVNVTAPSAGSHTYKYVATDGNGTTTTSGNISITTYAYVPPAFSSVSAVRWSTGNSSGTASDEGTYCKATANFSQGKVGTTAITTTCTIKVDTYTGTATNGTAIWLGGGNLSADNTYQVTFTLSDGYGNSVVTTDTLTQGGRGIDLIYGNGHYGVAIGQKATANRFDVNMATYINNADLTTNNGYLKSTKNSNTVTIGSQNGTFCHFMNSANILFYFNKGVSVDGKLYPYGNNAVTCGDSSHKWSAVYATQYYGSIAKLLWTNSTPKTYSGGTLNISLSGYTHIIVGGYAWGESQTGYFETVVKVGTQGMLFYGGMNGSTTSSAATFINMTFRPITVNSSSIVISNGSQTYNGSAYYNSWASRCVPVWIWGVSYGT